MLFIFFFNCKSIGDITTLPQYRVSSNERRTSDKRHTLVSRFNKRWGRLLEEIRYIKNAPGII